LTLLNAKDKSLLQEHHLRDIRSWASSTGTFAFSCERVDNIVESSQKSPSYRFLFETKQGSEISTLILMYSEYLCKEFEKGIGQIQK